VLLLLLLLLRRRRRRLAAAEREAKPQGRARPPAREWAFGALDLVAGSGHIEDNIRHGVFHGGCKALIAHRIC
jgi:hypothetical protein